MSIKATMISAVQALEVKLKRGARTPEVKEQLGCNDNRISQNLYGLCEDGLLKKSKEHSTGHNTYKVTAKGRKLLEQNVLEVFTIDQTREWYGQTSKAKAKSTGDSAARYSGQALGAIEGISALVSSNDRLLNTIRSIHSQLTAILKEHDNEQSSESSDI